MKPIFFSPILKCPLWSGSKIAALKGDGDLPSHIGESWEISGMDGDETRVAEGDDAGLTPAQLIAKHGAALIGAKNLERYGGRFPLLIKFISAGRDLSLQVHPSDEAAQRQLGHPFGKTEMWYVVEAAPGSQLIMGFNRPTSEEELRSALDRGGVLDLVRSHPTAAGQCYYIPAGRVHSIGAGNMVVEIQQPSNDTFRLYDYDRTDASGKRRPLHIDEACSVLNFDDARTAPFAYTPCPGSAVPLVHCEAFATDLVEADAPMRLSYDGLDSFVVLIAFGGSARFTTDGGDTFGLRAGQSVLIPATTRHVALCPDAAFRGLQTYCP